MAEKKQTNADEKSRRVVKEDGLEGEALQECSDKEWEQSEGAYSADLLNVKKKPNRVTVFAAPEKMVDAAGRSIRQMPVVVEVPVERKDTEDERLRGLSRLVTGVAKILMDSDKDVEVTVSMKFDRGKKETIAGKAK